MRKANGKRTRGSGGAVQPPPLPDCGELSTRFHAIMAAVPDIIMEVDAHKVYTWSNQAGMEFFGDDVVGKEAADYFEGEQDTYSRVQPIFEGDEDVFYVESWQRRRDGERRLLAWWCRALKDDGGRVTGALSTARDITDQKRSEDERTASENRYRTLVQTLPDAVIVTDLAGRITDVSRQTWELFGFEEESEMIGMPFFDLIAPESKARAVIYLHTTLKEGITRDLEYTLVRKTGERFFGEINTALIRDGMGRPEKFIATARDITSRKQDDLRLKTSIREKEMLLQEIHHRVKNNLQIISSLLDMSRMRLKDQDAVELISDACSRVQSMAFIHSQLYRTDTFERIDMRAHVEDLLGYLTDLYAADKRITPYIDISDVRLPLTQAVPCALVLNELISNAFKHAFKPGEEGIIDISMRVTEGRLLVIHVRDDGKGLGNEIELETADSLGLKLVGNLVERQLNGSLRVSRNRYTEFIIEFPISEDSHVEDPGRG